MKKKRPSCAISICQWDEFPKEPLTTTLVATVHMENPCPDKQKHADCRRTLIQHVSTHAVGLKWKVGQKTSNSVKSIPQTISRGGWPAWTLSHRPSSLFAKYPSQPLCVPTPFIHCYSYTPMQLWIYSCISIDTNIC